MRQTALVAALSVASACTEAGYAKLEAWSDAVKAPGIFRPQPDMPSLALPATAQQLEAFVASIGSETYDTFSGPDDGCEPASTKLGFSLPFETLARGVLGFDYESQRYMPGYAAHIDASGNVICIGKRFAYASFPSFGSPAN